MTKLDGAITFKNYPLDLIRVACAKCGREGRYPRENIIARFGRDAAMLDVLRELPRCARWSNAGGLCGARFPDLGSG